MSACSYRHIRKFAYVFRFDKGNNVCHKPLVRAVLLFQLFSSFSFSSSLSSSSSSTSIARKDISLTVVYFLKIDYSSVSPTPWLDLVLNLLWGICGFLPIEIIPSCPNFNKLVLYCIVLRCVALRCVALRCVVLRCVVLYCISKPMNSYNEECWK